MPKDVFCADEIYKQVFFETKNFIAAYNIRPLLPGHSLIISKRHVSSITDLSDGELADLKKMLKLLVPKLLKAYKADSYNLSINSGENAGMTIDHLHIHIVPRSGHDIFHWKIVDFYRELQKERKGYIADIEKEISRLRKLFRYAPAQ